MIPYAGENYKAEIQKKNMIEKEKLFFRVLCLSEVKGMI
jgi:hypothetical protein